MNTLTINRFLSKMSPSRVVASIRSRLPCRHSARSAPQQSQLSNSVNPSSVQIQSPSEAAFAKLSKLRITQPEPATGLSALLKRLSPRNLFRSQPQKTMHKPTEVRKISPVESLKDVSISCSPQSPIKQVDQVIQAPRIYEPYDQCAISPATFMREYRLRMYMEEQQAEKAAKAARRAAAAQIIKPIVAPFKVTIPNSELARQMVLNEMFFGTTALIHRF